MEKNGVDEVNKNQFNSLLSEPVLVVDFFAEWCMPCLMMAPVIEEMAEKFKGKIKFAKLNVDDNKELSQRFKVMSIPNLVIFKKGKEVDRITGAMQPEMLEEKLKGVLKS